jgi:hypothetical protein
MNLGGISNIFKLLNIDINVFFVGNFSKLHPKKYDLDLYKGFFMEKWLKFVKFQRKISKSQDFCDKF